MFHDAQYKTSAPATKFFAKAQTLFKANAGQLPKDNTRPPKIEVSTGPDSSVVTTDFFGFDTSDDHYGLKGLGDLSEMGDAILGMVARPDGGAAAVGCGAECVGPADQGGGDTEAAVDAGGADLQGVWAVELGL